MSVAGTAVLTMYLAFFAYLLMQGAGLRRAWEVMLLSALTGVGIGIVMAAVPYFYSAKIGDFVFVHFAVLGSFVGLLTQSMRRAREFAVPRSSTFEVVCLNVLVVAFGGPPDTKAFFEMFTELGYFVLVNPFGFLVPPDMGWLKMLLSLWPSALALLAVSAGPGVRLLRLFLMWWVQLICITWVFPASLNVLFGDGSSYMYLDIVLAAAGLVRVILALQAMRISLIGSSRSAEEFGLPEGQSVRSAFRQDLVDGFGVSTLPGWLHAAGGFGAYLLVNVALHFFEPDVAITGGFFALLGVSSLVERLGPAQAADSRTAASGALFSIALLVAGLLVLREQPLLPRYTWTAGTRSARPARPSPVRPAVVEPSSVRYLDMKFTRLTLDAMQACAMEADEGLRVRCAAESWPLASLSHPPGVRVPAAEVGSPNAIYRLQFPDFAAHCAELPILTPHLEAEGVLLLVFLENASLPGQVGWVTDERAECRDLRAGVFSDSPQGLPTIVFTSKAQRASGIWRGQKVVTLQRHSLEESAAPPADHFNGE